MSASHNVSSLAVDKLCGQSRGAKHNCYMFLPRLRTPKRAVCGQYSGILAETGRWRNGKGSGGTVTGLLRAEKGHR